MKIAVTYDNGNVFQHFGKTEYFKIYEVEENKVVSSEVMSSNGSGHGALAGLLADSSERCADLRRNSAAEHRVLLQKQAWNYVQERREIQMRS